MFSKLTMSSCHHFNHDPIVSITDFAIAAMQSVHAAEYQLHTNYLQPRQPFG